MSTILKVEVTRMTSVASIVNFGHILHYSTFIIAEFVQK